MRGMGGKMNNKTIYRRRNTDMLVKIIDSTESQVKLSVVSGPVRVGDFWVSQNFFGRNFTVYERGKKR